MPNGEITLQWAGESRLFNIAKLGQLLELEEKCGAGVSEILVRLRSEKWFYRDMREVVRLSLIGGGTPPNDAAKLVERYVDDRPWRESLPVAVAVLFAGMVGVVGDPLGKPPAEVTKTETDQSQPDLSAPPSTESEPPLASPQDKPTS